MTFKNQKTTCITLLLTFFIISGYGQINLEKKIDSLLQPKFKPQESGAVAMVSKNGTILYKKAFGMANLELEVPMKTNHVFEIGSMTKQFTAISILMLMEQGKLKLEDDITKYIQDYPTHGQHISIHHLLTHTSGIKSYTSIKAFYEITKNDLTPKELIDFFKNEPIDFNSGEDYKYNNSGYIILGQIIEMVSNKTYEEFIEDNIFHPLEMKASFYGSQKSIIKNKASGYNFKNDQYFNSPYISFTLPYAAGSLMSTVDDLIKWQNAIKNNLLISESTKQKAFTNYTLSNGEPINYGYGWNIKTIEDIKIYEHGGMIPGFKSMAIYIPSEDVYIVILTNCDCNSPTEITRTIASEIINTFEIKK